MNRGLLIAIEGIDGSGKSTLARNLFDLLKSSGLDALLTLEPGGTPLGKNIRHILHEEKEKVCDLSEYLLFAADRAQHYETIVIPALEENKIVVQDRSGDSSVAYQGYGRGLDRTMIEAVNRWAMQGTKIDVTIFVRIEAETSFERIHARGEKLTSFEQENLGFMQRVAQGFDEMYKDRNTVLILDGILTQDELAAAALKHINKVLKNLP